MPLHSLLFSSRQETSCPLIQALQELELSVEHSAEIFAAIKELTSRSFDLIVADLDEGPEAEFLLKTARELRINRNAFVLAVASNTRNSEGPYSRAELVLAKPLIPEQIKYSLLGCDRFLVAYMQGGAEHARFATQPTTALERKPSTSILMPALNRRAPVPRQ
jgi:hypothetical protein